MGRHAAPRLLILCLTLLLASCSKGSKSPLTPTLSTPTMETEMRSGQVSSPPNATIAPTDLRAVSFAASGAVATDGKFEVESPKASKFQMLFITDKSSGKAVYIALYDPTTRQLAANDTSTALALTLINPLLIYATQEQRVEYLNAVKNNARFGQLINQLRIAYATDAATALDNNVNPATFQLAGEIMHDALVSLGGGAFRANPEVSAASPYVEDASGADINFVNPTHVWYAAGVYDHNDAHKATVAVGRRETIMEFHLGWPPIVVTQPAKTAYALGDGSFRLHLAKGLDYTRFSDWNDPIGQATVLNTFTGFVYIIELAVGTIPALSDVQIATLPQHLHVSAARGLELSAAIANGDEFGLLRNLVELIGDNADELAYWFWQNVPNAAVHQYLGLLANLAENFSLVFKVLGFTNAQAPFFWDLVSSPKEVTYFVAQTDGALTMETPDSPPVGAFTIFPPAGVVNTEFLVDAGTSHDDEDALADLRFRWDWEGDGVWDTGWSANTQATHAYASKGAYRISLEVKDRRNQTGLATHTVSVGGGRGTANHVKLFMDNLPWESYALTNVLISLGFTPGQGANTYEVLTSNKMGTTSLTPGEDLVVIANDQNQEFYDNYAQNQLRFASFALGGGSIFWEASDLGWANGSMELAGVVLPGNLMMAHFFDYYNYLRNSSLPLVAGLPPVMDHNYASHESFGNLPDGATIYCVNSSNEPTLLEFNYGDGWILVTGQPLEHQYDRIYEAPDMEQLLPRIVAYFTGRGIPTQIAPLVRGGPLAPSDRSSAGSRLKAAGAGPSAGREISR